jgi:hypothetical protein
MPTLRTYQKPEEACIDAGYLCSMGIEAMVTQAPAYGGILLGVIESPHFLDVPDSQLDQAMELLSQRPIEPSPATIPQDVPIDSARLHRFFRFILFYDVACHIAFPFFGHLLSPEPPPPVAEFLASLALSDVLWRLAYISYWPVIITGLLSSVFCYLYLPLGRTLFAVTTVWSIVIQLGPPPMIFSPSYGFFGGIQGTLTSIALALMYWSPLRDRFTRRSDA